MLNVILNIDNYYFLYGLECLLRQDGLFFGRKIDVNYCLEDSLVERADIIVTTFSAGEAYICHDVFKNRKPGSLLICICSGKVPTRFSPLPACFKDAVFINWHDATASLIEKIQRHISKSTMQNTEWVRNKCLNCVCRSLSMKQFQIANYIYCGVSSKKIASTLGISAKTVYSHKQQLMCKFDLKTDYELVEFLNLIRK